MQNPRKKDTEQDITTLNEFNDAFIGSYNTHFLVGDVERENIDKAIRWIVHQNLQKSESKLLSLYINSDGGSLNDAFALIDIMRNSMYPIRTIGIGSVSSAAFLIFSAGTKGERFIGKNTSSMCHQFSDEVTGKYHDLKAAMKEHDNVNLRMANLLTEVSGLDMKTVKTKLLPTTDAYFTAEQMVEMGIADHIL
jgi:ATP-dependent Clp endopeptidase proteolytic subunit ClpP